MPSAGPKSRCNSQVNREGGIPWYHLTGKARWLGNRRAKQGRLARWNLLATLSAGPGPLHQ